MQSARNGQDASDLVPLEVPDHVPANIRHIGEFRGAGQQCLNAILAKISQAEFEQLSNRGHVDGLGHREKANLLAGSSALCGGFGDIRLDSSQIVRELRCVHEGIIAPPENRRKAEGD